MVKTIDEYLKGAIVGKRFVTSRGSGGFVYEVIHASTISGRFYCRIRFEGVRDTIDLGKGGSSYEDVEYED